jgi:hypothetical protein
MEVDGQLHAPAGRELPARIGGNWLGIRTGLSSVQRSCLCKFNTFIAALLVNLEGNLCPIERLVNSHRFLSYSDMFLHAFAFQILGKLWLNAKQI